MGKQVILITGASSGIGLDAAVTLAKAGNIVYATMRNLKKDNALKEAAKKANVKLNIEQLDVNDVESINRVVQKIYKEQKHIDVLINNAGYGVVGTLEGLEVQKYREQFETNFFGVLTITKAVLPAMRKRRSGRIIVVSSTGGRVAFPFYEAYVASKFAIEGQFESLVGIYKKFNVHFITVQPGPVATSFFNNVDSSEDKNYPEEVLPLKNNFNKNFFKFVEDYKLMQQPSDVSKVLLKATTDENPDFRYITNEAQSKSNLVVLNDLTGNVVVKNTAPLFESS